MAEEDLSQISVGEFENVSQLLVSSESLQFAFILMVVGIIAIVLGYGKFSNWVKSQKIYYTRPHLSRFIRRAILPFFAIALITSTNAYMQTSGVFEQDVIGGGDLSAEATFAKILNTFNILVIGYTVSHLIPIALTKREKSTLEKEDFDAWFDFRGFSDDDADLFHKMYKAGSRKAMNVSRSLFNIQVDTTAVTVMKSSATIFASEMHARLLQTAFPQ